MNKVTRIFREDLVIDSISVTEMESFVKNTVFDTPSSSVEFWASRKDKKSYPTPETKVEVYELVRDAKYPDIFNEMTSVFGLQVKKEDLCLTQSQIVNFFKKYRKFFKHCQHINVPFMSKEGMSIASVFNYDGGVLISDIYTEDCNIIKNSGVRPAPQMIIIPHKEALFRNKLGGKLGGDSFWKDQLPIAFEEQLKTLWRLGLSGVIIEKLKGQKEEVLSIAEKVAIGGNIPFLPVVPIASTDYPLMSMVKKGRQSGYVEDGFDFKSSKIEPYYVFDIEDGTLDMGLSEIKIRKRAFLDANELISLGIHTNVLSKHDVCGFNGNIYLDDESFYRDGRPKLGLGGGCKRRLASCFK